MPAAACATMAVRRRSRPSSDERAGWCCCVGVAAAAIEPDDAAREGGRTAAQDAWGRRWRARGTEVEERMLIFVVRTTDPARRAVFFLRGGAAGFELECSC